MYRLPAFHITFLEPLFQFISELHPFTHRRAELPRDWFQNRSASFKNMRISYQKNAKQKLELQSMHTKNRNLFIDIHLPEDNYSPSSLLNNWTRPPPLEFHLINSPTLTHHLSIISPQQKHKPALTQSDQSKKQANRAIHGERLKYQRFEQQLQFLQQFLLQFKDLKASEILTYRQTLLVRYLNELVMEINAECKQKGHFLQSIWNAFIRIFQEVFQRVVNDSKLKERESLKQSINLHEEYQSRLQILTQNNKYLKAEEAKSTAVIEQLAKNIAMLNVELKGARALQDKSSIAFKELTHKYEQLRAEHVQLLTASNALSWTEAQARLQDQQLLLFSKKVGNSQIAIKLKQKAKRRGRVLNNNIEVELLIQQLQAESQYSFSLNSSVQQDQKVRYVHQRVQTTSIKKEEIQAIDQGLQCTNFVKTAEAQTQTPSLSQTIVRRVQTETQTDSKDILAEIALKLHSCLNFNAKLQFNLHIDKKPAETETSQIYTPIMKTEQSQTQTNPKTVSPADLLKYKTPSHIKERSSGKLAENKMFRVGQGSKISKRGSNLYRQKILKTQGASDNESINYSMKRQSCQKKVSELLLIEELRQEYIRNYSRFRTGAPKLNFPEQFRNCMHQNLDGRRLQQGVMAAQISISTPSKLIQNLQFSVAYSGLIDKIWEAMGTDRRKKISPGKCMKEAGSIFKMATKFVNQGVFSLDLISIATQYLSAMEGKHLGVEQKQKKFIDFIISCVPLASSSYMIKSLLLLCGLPFGRTYYLRTSKTDQKPREEDKLDKDTSKYLFSSEVYSYFKLLTLANCQQSDQILQAYTNQERFLESLHILPALYKGSDGLYQEIKLSVKQSIQTSLQKNPKLDIFKSLHLVVDKVLSFKAKIIQSLEPLALLIKTPDLSFASQVISLLTDHPNSRLICMHVLKVLYTGKYTPQNLATIAIIEGLQIETFRFAAVQQEHKFTILKRLMSVESHKDRLLEAMIKAIPKKELRKQQFLIMLRLLWNKQVDRLMEDMMGEELGTLYNLGIGLSLSTPNKDSFHSVAFDNVFQ